MARADSVGLSRTVPWLVTAALVALVAATADLGAMVEASRLARLVPFVVCLVAASLAGMVYDGWCYALFFGRYVGPVGFADGLRLRVASSLLAGFNYVAGQALVSLYVKKIVGAPFFKVASVSILTIFVDTYLLALFATCGAWVAVPDMLEPILWIDAGFAVLGAAHFIFWLGGVDFFLLGFVREMNVCHAFRQSTLWDYIRVATLRVPTLLLDVLTVFVLLRCFGVNLPFWAVVATVPIIDMVVFLPVTVAGLGSFHLACRELFGSELGAPIPTVDAFATLFLGLGLLLRVLVGLVGYRSLLARLNAPGASTDR
ncbi:MAG: flippase-like domain-containing protein [Candidatus Riflebacteria bacterium]|nr:flippase-like domain-containing protein [Candidatus Riflebacteria bacterium]